MENFLKTGIEEDEREPKGMLLEKGTEPCDAGVLLYMGINACICWNGI